MRKFGLKPLINEESEVLILGAFPSDLSLSQAQYYANRTNDFWKLLGAVLKEPLTGATYETRVQTLLAKKIGLWDVYRSCARPGSMDRDISDREFNDFRVLKTIAPHLRLVCFNGKEAGKSEVLAGQLGYRTRILPSSSGANRKHQGRRLNEWKKCCAEVLHLRDG